MHKPHSAAVKVDQHPLVWVHVEALGVLDLKMSAKSIKEHVLQLWKRSVQVFYFLPLS